MSSAASVGATGNGVLGGLSYGVLKEQEFGFRSKLTMSSRSRAYSLPTSHHQPCTTSSVSAGSEMVDGHHQQERQGQHQPHGIPLPVGTGRLRRAVKEHYEEDEEAQMVVLQEEQIYVTPQSSGKLSTIREEPNFPYLSSVAHTFVKQQQASFISGDPHSDRLAEFVSRMVYIIFWAGSDSFVNILSDTASFKDIHEMHSVSMFPPSSDFVSYTRYLLQTMQVSCSTALLSLFYLHRLRPRVKHLFVAGTFNDEQYQTTPTSSKYQVMLSLVVIDDNL